MLDNLQMCQVFLLGDHKQLILANHDCKKTFWNVGCLYQPIYRRWNVLLGLPLYFTVVKWWCSRWGYNILVEILKLCTYIRLLSFHCLFSLNFSKDLLCILGIDVKLNNLETVVSWYLWRYHEKNVLVTAVKFLGYSGFLNW